MVKLMAARYAGKCKNCGGLIEVGSLIHWSKGQGAAHPDCRQPAQATTERTIRGFPVGCTGVAEVDGHYHYSNGDCDTEVEGSNLWLGRANAEYQQGVALGDHIRSTRQFFGEAAAVAEEMAWESRLGY